MSRDLSLEEWRAAVRAQQEFIDGIAPFVNWSRVWLPRERIAAYMDARYEQPPASWSNIDLEETSPEHFWSGWGALNESLYISHDLAAHLNGLLVRVARRLCDEGREDEALHAIGGAYAMTGALEAYRAQGIDRRGPAL